MTYLPFTLFKLEIMKLQTILMNNLFYATIKSMKKGRKDTNIKRRANYLELKVEKFLMTCAEMLPGQTV